MVSIFRTILFFGFFSFTLSAAGYIILGETGLYIGFFLSWFIIIAGYLFSEKLLLSLTGARILDPTASPDLFILIKDVCSKLVLPMPKIYITSEIQANICSVGRGPHNASIIITRGLINSLSREEMLAVLFYELGRVKSYSCLSISVGAALAAAILFLANMSFYNIQAGRDDNQKNFLVKKLISFLILCASFVIKLTVSRGRVLVADRKSAKVLESGAFLSSALSKLNDSVEGSPMQTNPALSSLYIVNPFGETEDKIVKLFSLQPPVAERLKRLEKI